MKRRQATPEEVIEHFTRFGRASYRHFVKEILNLRAEHGVSHRDHTSARIHDVDGVPHVTYNGLLAVVTATHFTLESGTTFLADLRIDSVHLPEKL